VLAEVSSEPDRHSAIIIRHSRSHPLARWICMGKCRSSVFVAGVFLFASLAAPIEARKHPTKKFPRDEKQSPEQIEAAARLQIFLDRSNFSPGKIDGHYNESAWKALALYRQARGEPPPAHAKVDAPPDINGRDLA